MYEYVLDIYIYIYIYWFCQNTLLNLFFGKLFVILFIFWQVSLLWLKSLQLWLGLQTSSILTKKWQIFWSPTPHKLYLWKYFYWNNFTLFCMYLLLLLLLLFITSFSYERLLLAFCGELMCTNTKIKNDVGNVVHILSWATMFV